MKRRTNETLADLVTARLEQINPKAYKIKGMSDVASYIKANRKRHFFIIGDYDVDGVMATSIMYKLLSYLKIDVEYYIPHRFSDGYGANPQIVDLIPDNSVVIMVDNGIVAFPAVTAAKEKGCNVIILDHHLKAENGEFPDADFIIDPNAIDGQCKFTDYCGAGLCYKLAELMDISESLLEECSALAAYATIADVVPLRGENWLIASNLDKAYCNTGLNTLLHEMKVEGTPSSDDAGFKVCPAINAPGRLIDDGATRSLELMLEDDPAEAENKAKNLRLRNEERKMLVEIGMKKVEKILARDGFDRCIAIITDIHPGIVGIVAGKLAEKYLVPSFVFADAGNGIIKGSARTAGDNHLKKMLDSVSDLLTKYGGHAAAAGLSMPIENIEAFRERIAEISKPVNIDDMLLYDDEVDQDNFLDAISEIERAAPYGEGNPPFIFKTSLSINDKRPYIMLGKYLKLVTNENIDVLCFDEVPDTGAITTAVDVLGPISVNEYKGKPIKQIEAKTLVFN